MREFWHHACFLSGLKFSSGAVIARSQIKGKKSSHGTQQDSPHRVRHDRRHARPPYRPQGPRRRRDVRHRRRHSAGQGARHRPIRAGRGLRCALSRRQRLRRDRGRRRLHRHRWRTEEAWHEPRRPDRRQPQGDGAGRGGHSQIRAESLRHLHHQSARRHGLGIAEILRPAQDHVVGMAGILDRRAFAISSPRSSRCRSRT